MSAVATSTQAVSLATSTSTSTPNVLSPEVTSLSAAETSDPLRGQYRWMGYGSQPSTWPAIDVYYRDQTYWGRLEPTKGVYDFKWIEDGLKKAAETKGKFGFRVMAWCPECWMTVRTDKIAFPSVLPSYVPVVKGTDVPDWNSEEFLSGYERLMAALGAKYANDPRLGYVDVGGYGKFGEWWVGKDDLHITEANGLRLVQAVNKAFPKKIILFNTMQSVDFTLKALATNPRMGMRTDSLGEKNMYSMLAVDDPAAVVLDDPADLQRVGHQRRPRGRGRPGQAVPRVDHVEPQHEVDVRPDDEHPEGRLRERGQVRRVPLRRDPCDGVPHHRRAAVPGRPHRQQRRQRTDLRAVDGAPGPQGRHRPPGRDASDERGPAQAPAGTTTTAVYLTAPKLATGTYRTFIEAVDPSGYSAPLHWLNGPRYSDGTYALGAVGVGMEAVGRLAGSDRYATSAAISAATFAPGVPVAYVAVGGNFPDALSGAPAGGVKKGPVLLATPSSIPAAVQQELIRLKPARIVILGGSGTVSDSVKAALRAYTTGSVTRLAGSDRYSTSAAISAATFAPGVPVAYVAVGGNFPDALSGAPAGGVKKRPGAARGSEVDPRRRPAELERLRPARIVILGGSGTVSDSVKAALRPYTTGSVTRLAGSDRYATSAAISAATFAPGAPVAYVAVGGNFPDALSGAPAGGVKGGPVLLVAQTSIPGVIQEELDAPPAGAHRHPRRRRHRLRLGGQGPERVRLGVLTPPDPFRRLLGAFCLRIHALRHTARNARPRGGWTPVRRPFGMDAGQVVSSRRLVTRATARGPT